MPLIMFPSTSLSLGILKYELVDPDGVVRDFTWQTSPQRFVPAGSIGFGTAKFSIEEQKLPVNPGSFIKRINTEARALMIPIVIDKPTFADLLDEVDLLHQWFDTGDENHRTPIYWRVTRPDGTIRQIQGYYTGGLEGDLSEGTPTFVKFVGEFYCPDPSPTSNVEVEGSVVITTLSQTFAINNTGTKNAYPYWKVHGPFTNFNVVNNNTGEGFSVILTLPAGKYIVIDTRPAEQKQSITMFDSDGVNRMPTLYPTSKLFQLEPGVNSINFEFTSGIGGSTSVDYSFLPRFRGMLR